MDKVSAMKAFVRVVEAGTFTRAAESLDLPKAQVTRLVQSLEAHLRTQLLNRTTRRVVVTADGGAYYERAVRLLDDIEELESSMTHAKVNPRGRLRVDVVSPIANLILIPALDEFRERYPDVQLEMGVTERPVDLVGENVDCVIRAGTVGDPSLVARRIGDAQRVLLASPAYLARFGTPRHPSDLENEGHRVLTYFAYGNSGPYLLRRDGQTCEVHPKSSLALNDSTSMLIATLAGLGIGRSACFMASAHVAERRLQRLLPDWDAGTLPVHVVYPPNRHVSAKLRVFIDWAAALIARELARSAMRVQSGEPDMIMVKSGAAVRVRTSGECPARSRSSSGSSR